MEGEVKGRIQDDAQCFGLSTCQMEGSEGAGIDYWKDRLGKRLTNSVDI